VDSTYSAFGYQGQKCSALSRLIVLDENYDRVIKRLVEAAASLRVGNPEIPGIMVGPVIDEIAYRRILETIEAGKKETTLAFKGKDFPAEGFFVPPTIFTDVSPTMRLTSVKIVGGTKKPSAGKSFPLKARVVSFFPASIVSRIRR